MRSTLRGVSPPQAQPTTPKSAAHTPTVDQEAIIKSTPQPQKQDNIVMESAASSVTEPNKSPKMATNKGFNAPEGTYGPHSSRIANALDPRVDSDLDGHPKSGLHDFGGVAKRGRIEIMEA
ncbi:hypothetical protein B0H66DRAFT_559592 [Apodospora peruviana]|uniref:Uncharacterized protein n=1 Tax=Apodospora peruviana TaxID=516989 RepID=A0AAE0I066_9PEZI|nr:hypothetical protein B0H66DRAFT_559592 [Apodospora peruviana]